MCPYHCTIPLHFVHTRIRMQAALCREGEFFWDLQKSVTESDYLWSKKGPSDGSFPNVPASGESKGLALSELLMHESHAKGFRAGAGLLQYTYFLPPHLSSWHVSVIGRKTDNFPGFFKTSSEGTYFSKCPVSFQNGSVACTPTQVPCIARAKEEGFSVI